MSGPGENVPGEPHPGFENGHVADRSPGYVPGEPDAGFENGTIPDSHAVNSAAVGSSNADPVGSEPEADTSGRPPLGGAGSGIDEWRAYADTLGLDIDEDATRADIIAAVEHAES